MALRLCSYVRYDTTCTAIQVPGAFQIAKGTVTFYSALDRLPIPSAHGLRTPNEGINQRYLKNRADVADKICFGRT